MTVVAEVAGRATATIALSNSGAAEIAVLGFAVREDRGPWSVVTNPPLVPAGGDATVTVRFSPGTAGTFQDTLTVIHEGANSPLTVPLEGTASARPAALSAEPASIAAQAIVGQEIERTVSLVNRSGRTVVVGQVSVEPAGAWYSFASGPMLLSDGSSTVVPILYRPITAGTHAATLRVVHDASGSPLEVALSGEAAAPPAAFTAEPLELVLATEAGSEVRGTVVFTNSTDAPVEVTAVELQQASADWQADASSFTVAAGESKELVVTYAPPCGAGEGPFPFDAKLVVTHNGPGSPLVIYLRGTARGTVSVQPDMLDLRSPVGRASAGEVTLRNTMHRAIYLTDLAVQSSADGPWSTPGGGEAVAACDALTMRVEYRPSEAGTDEATLEIWHTGTNPPLRVSLHGTAALPPAGDACRSPVAVDLVSQPEVWLPGQNLSWAGADLGWLGENTCRDPGLPGGGLSLGAYDAGDLFYDVSLPADAVLQVWTTGAADGLDLGLFAYGASATACPDWPSLACLAATDVGFGTSPGNAEALVLPRCGTAVPAQIKVVAAAARLSGAGTFGITFRRAGCSDEEQEPNDTAATATPLVLGRAMGGRINKPLSTGNGDEDFFSFEARPGLLTVSVDGGGGAMVPRVLLTDRLGNYRRTGRDPGGAQLFAREFFIPSAGTFYLSVAHAPNLSSPPVGADDGSYRYRLMVTQTADFTLGVPTATPMSVPYRGAYTVAPSGGVYRLGLFSLAAGAVDPRKFAAFRAWVPDKTSAAPWLWLWNASERRLMFQGGGYSRAWEDLIEGRDAVLGWARPAAQDCLLVVDFEELQSSEVTVQVSHTQVPFRDESATDAPDLLPTPATSSGAVDNRAGEEDIALTGKLDGTSPVPDRADTWRLYWHPGHVYGIALVVQPSGALELPPGARIDLFQGDYLDPAAAPYRWGEDIFQGVTYRYTWWVPDSGPPPRYDDLAQTGGSPYYLRVYLPPTSYAKGNYTIVVLRHRCPPSLFPDAASGDLVLNEVFPARPGHGLDANGSGAADGRDAFVELVNVSSRIVHLGGFFVGAEQGGKIRPTYGIHCGAHLPPGSAMLAFEGGPVDYDALYGFGPWWVDYLWAGGSLLLDPTSVNRLVLVASDLSTILHSAAVDCGPGGADCAQSITQDDRVSLPSLAGPFVSHPSLAGLQASPGRRADGVGTFTQQAESTDQCASAAPIVPGYYPALSTAGLANSYECALAPAQSPQVGRNAFYWIHLKAGETLAVRARNSDWDAGAYDLALALTTDCTRPEACVATVDTTNFGKERLFYRAPAEGDYVLVVDSNGRAEGSGRFYLAVGVREP